MVYLHNYVVVYAVNFSMWSGRYFLHQCFKDRFVLELKPVSFIHLLLRKSTCHSVSPFYPSRAEVFVRTKFSFLSSPPLPSPPFPTKAEAEVLMKKTFFFFESYAFSWSVFWTPFDQFTINSNSNWYLPTKLRETRKYEFNIYHFLFFHVCHWLANWIF